MNILPCIADYSVIHPDFLLKLCVAGELLVKESLVFLNFLHLVFDNILHFSYETLCLCAFFLRIEYLECLILSLRTRNALIALLHVFDCILPLVNEILSFLMKLFKGFSSSIKLSLANLGFGDLGK